VFDPLMPDIGWDVSTTRKWKKSLRKGNRRIVDGHGKRERTRKKGVGDILRLITRAGLFYVSNTTAWEGGGGTTERQSAIYGRQKGVGGMETRRVGLKQCKVVRIPEEEEDNTKGRTSLEKIKGKVNKDYNWGKKML